ncbi:unnamed protein product [Prorocentrum cordatum]|uniref:Cleavage stimulation factor subunit 2 n=1 Tax=Prorocentrum cordatum TaxID=2364126 RepID=A0ABN9WPJ2_9DINO|nr:unnamed protein product [Polarella glacialis]|mmetsp:Transcript_6085/g.16434  ORF Transcript_6085/g.16434 Transcript_6085/m.16434 type:complete len:377 (+) Transcript_6085:83-1213(+)
MEGPVDGAQLMAVYGIDEKALMALQKLAPERQSECLQKLQEGINSGKVRNASAFLIGIVTGPDALGIDDRARAMLNELPKPMQVELLNKLRMAVDVQNPSAWLISAVIKAKKTVGLAGMGGMMGMMAGGQMLGMGGNGMLGAQMMFGKMGGPRMGGMMARASPYGSPPQTTGSVPSNPEALQQVMVIIDEKARTLLQQLPEEKQVELASFLQARIQGGTVMNPSGWMVKSCLAAGAKSESIPGGNPRAMGGGSMGMGCNPMGMGGGMMGMTGTGSMGSMGGCSPAQSVRSATASPTVPQMPQAVPMVMMILDDKAKTLLQQLPYEKQVDLASFLQQKMQVGGIKNPSAWMAKSCLAAGARTESDAAGFGAGSLIGH